MKLDTATLTGTAILAALVVVFDYTLKYSNLKIPFPPAPFLRFDLTGIPIVLSLLLYGFVPGIFTSAIASIAILARSADALGSSMKGLAEFSTILGMFLAFKLFNKMRIVGAFALGITMRVLIMTFANLLVIYVGLMAIPASYVNIPLLYFSLLGAFNAAQGTISVAGGLLIYEAVKKRISTKINKT
ncbi:MAG: hypothetical protein QW667_05050 [Candidatus Bathyarchaeia archaeon]